jgi:hypothetical protein
MLPDGPGKDAAVRIAMQLACGLPTAPLAAACDEAIDNRDRNLGNILWDGRDEAWIDHAMALGQGGAFPDRNLLCHLAMVIGQEERFCRATVAHSFALERTTASSGDAALLTSPLGVTNLGPFVAARLATIGNRLLARFPIPPDLLSNA